MSDNGTTSTRTVLFAKRGIPKGTLTVDGWKLFIRQGRYEARDRQIYVQAPGAPEPDLVSMPALAAMVRALFMNEDVIRGPQEGLQGGRYLLDFLAAVCIAERDGKLSPLQTACRDYNLPVPTVEFERVPMTVHGAPTDEPPPSAPADSDPDARQKQA